MKKIAFFDTKPYDRESFGTMHHAPKSRYFNHRLPQTGLR